METAIVVNLTRTIRSAKTGMLLLRRGRLVSVRENLGRTLLLVEFDNGENEYLFEQVELNENESTQTSASATEAYI